MQGLKLWQFDTSGNMLGSQFSSNPAWVLLDMLMRCGYSFDDIDTVSFAQAAAYADQLISVDDPVGGNVQLPRFQCNFALTYSRSAGDLIRSIRNGSRIYVVLGTSGVLEARIENTFALQQPTLPPNSNSTEQFNGGWPAYEFDATSIAAIRTAAPASSCLPKARRIHPIGFRSNFRTASISISRIAFRLQTKTT